MYEDFDKFDAACRELVRVVKELVIEKLERLLTLLDRMFFEERKP